MTQEQKAKAYDEALERAKSWAEGKVEVEEPKSVAEFIFPELKVSEDERIRKFLIQHISEWIGCIEHDLKNSSKDIESEKELAMFKAGLAYLEKQKYDRMQPVYDNLDSFESALAKAWKAYNDSGSRTVDGCEDDYVECAHAKGFREGYLFGLEKQKEQKLECSEEDKNMIERIVETIQDYALETGQIDAETGGTKEPLISYINFLWSLCPQQKQAWNEEDEKMLEGTIMWLNDLEKQGEYVEKERDWLKSLRPQSHWKPSEEQPSDDLEEAARRMGGTMDDFLRDMVELGKVLNVRKEEGK